MQIVGVIGTGTMGCGVAQIAAQARCQVIFQNRRQDSVNRGIASSLSRLVSKDKLTPAQAEGVMSRIRGVVPLEELKGCDIVLESAPREGGAQARAVP